jgi:hypothetical protein
MDFRHALATAEARIAEETERRTQALNLNNVGYKRREKCGKALHAQNIGLGGHLSCNRTRAECPKALKPRRHLSKRQILPSADHSASRSTGPKTQICPGWRITRIATRRSGCRLGAGAEDTGLGIDRSLAATQLGSNVTLCCHATCRRAKARGRTGILFENKSEVR